MGFPVCSPSPTSALHAVLPDTQEEGKAPGVMDLETQEVFLTSMKVDCAYNQISPPFD